MPTILRVSDEGILHFKDSNARNGDKVSNFTNAYAMHGFFGVAKAMEVDNQTTNHIASRASIPGVAMRYM